MYLLCLSMRFRKSSLGGKIFFVTPTSRDFHEKLTFLENAQEASRKLLGCVGSGRECLEVAGSHFRLPKVEKKIPKISTFFMLDDVFGCSAVRWLSFKSPCSDAIHVQSSRIRGPRRRRLYGSLAR